MAVAGTIAVEVRAGFPGKDTGNGVGEEESRAGWQALPKIRRSKRKTCIVRHVPRWSKENKFFINDLPQ